MKVYKVLSISKDKNIYIQKIQAKDIAQAENISQDKIKKMGWDRFEYVVNKIEQIESDGIK